MDDGEAAGTVSQDIEERVSVGRLGNVLGTLLSLQGKQVEYYRVAAGGHFLSCSVCVRVTFPSHGLSYSSGMGKAPNHVPEERLPKKKLILVPARRAVICIYIICISLLYLRRYEGESFGLDRLN